jgi:D-beta-D-heptose 7-phosphate kinase/D-beta-D-heptose 1-phosphate adenosyltransferase
MNYLIIGEQCTDVFVYGRCDRLSPEAPVPVFEPLETKINVGMAGNVSANLHAIHKSANNTDYYIWEMLSDLTEMIKTRYVDKKSNHIFLRVDTGTKVSKRAIVGRYLKEKIMDSDVIIVSDYNKGFIDQDFIPELRKYAYDKPIFLDSKSKLTEQILEAVDFVKLNEPESKEIKFDLYEKMKNKIITTLGGRGAMYEETIYETKEVQTIDVSGAGDTFVAGLVYEYMKSGDIKKAIKFANKQASIVVTKRGVSTI